MASSEVDSRHVKQHVLDHKYSLSEVISMKSSISPGIFEMASYLHEFLVHWLAYHILA